MLFEHYARCALQPSVARPGQLRLQRLTADEPLNGSELRLRGRGWLEAQGAEVLLQAARAEVARLARVLT